MLASFRYNSYNFEPENKPRKLAQFLIPDFSSVFDININSGIFTASQSILLKSVNNLIAKRFCSTCISVKSRVSYTRRGVASLLNFFPGTIVLRSSASYELFCVRLYDVTSRSPGKFLDPDDLCLPLRSSKRQSIGPFH